MKTKVGLKKGVRPYTPLRMARRGIEHDPKGMSGSAVLLLAIVVAVLCWVMGAADAAPTINSMYNDATNNSDTYVPITYGTTVRFVVGADEAIANWTWSKDGIVQGVYIDELYMPFTSPWGYHNITAYGTTAGGIDSNTATWTVWTDRETTATPLETMNETPIDTVKQSIAGDPSFELFLEAIAMPYTSMIGTIFYLFIFGIPLMMMYIRQDSMAIPVTIMFLTGSMMLFMLPPQWKLIGGALMALGLLGALYRLYKERER